MKVVLIGATGATGKELLQLLLADKVVTEIVALVRKPLIFTHPKLKALVVDFDVLHNWSSSINGDIAFSCLGTTLKDAGGKAAQYKVDYQYQYEFAKLAKSNNIPVFSLISSSNANTNSFIYYPKMKGELEDAIDALNFDSFTVFRPGPLERPASDRMGEKMAVAVIKFLNGLGILKNMKPLPVKSLAMLMLKHGKRPRVGRHILEAREILSELK